MSGTATGPTIDTRPWSDRVMARALRPAFEYAQLVCSPVFWGRGVPRGDGHTVLVIPGYGAGDRYCSTLRWWLRRMGYRTVRSGLYSNPGWSLEIVQRLGKRLRAAHERSGEPVTIVGHSIGGVIARSLAVGNPDAVRQLVVLSAPMKPGRQPLSPSVPITAIRSPNDVVVPYEHAHSHDPHGVMLDVRGSHTGLVWNAAVYRILGDLLPKGLA